MWWKRSLKARLTALILIPAAFMVVAIGVLSFISARQEAEEIYDAQLAHLAKLLLAIEMADTEALEARLRETQLPSLPYGHKYEKNIVYRVWRNGRLEHVPAGIEELGPMSDSLGFTTRVIGTRKWRFFTVHDPSTGLTVETAERDSIRQEMDGKIFASVFSPLLFILIGTPPLLWLGLRYGLQPLQDLSASVESRSASDLSPVATCNLPREVQPLVIALNDLLERLGEAITSERRFTDNAAHELRTPLAAIRTYAQAAEETTDEAARRSVHAKLICTIDRATHTVSQLLELARIKQLQEDPSLISLRQICARICDEMQSEISGKSLKMNLAFEEDGLMSYPGLVALILRNLIGNAVQYTPPGGAVWLSSARRGQETIIRVEDSGPGIPAHEQSLIFEAFYRGTGSHASQGAGIGLSIVKAACELAGIGICYAPRDGGGSCFELHIPA